MSPSHSNLHFVNVSKPNGGKDEETRRAVRTHVMQQYIQKRRLQEKRRASHTPLERAAQLPCVCLTTKAVPQPFGTSSGRHKSGFGICPECRGRRWAITNTGRDGSDGGILAQEQAVNRFSSRGPPDHPATLLGAGRVDPFGVYPVEAQPYMHDLLDHYFVLLGQALIPAKITGQQSPFLTKWMRLALRCPALFYGTLLVSSSHYAATRIDKRDETWVLVNRSHAIQALNEALADPHQAISDENIAAVINLAGHELLVGNLPFYTCHMVGLEKMVAMRGGLHTLGLDGLTEALAHWVDQMGVALTGSMPRFPPAPIPTLVPQTKPSVPGLPPPTTPPTTPLEIPSPNVPQLVGGDHERKRPTTSCASNPTPYPPNTGPNPAIGMAPQATTNLPLNSAISSLPAKDPSTLPRSESPGRDEATDMFEVGRFASIVYPQRRWKGFTNYVATQPPPQQAPVSIP